MRVKLLCSRVTSGPRRAYQPEGSEIDLDQDEAIGLVESGCAVAVGGAAPASQPPPAPVDAKSAGRRGNPRP